MNDHVTSRAGRREWIGLAVLALPCLLVSMDMTVLNLAVPELSADLQPSSSQLLWIVDIYGFLIAGSLITMGTLGDRIGRRRLLLIGAAGFGAASVCAAFADSAELLIAARALLGVAGATLAPSTLSLIRNMFLDPRQRTMAIGVWVTSFSVGGAVGPLVGGALLELFWWGSVFLLSVPVMVLLLVLGPLLLPEFRDPEAGRLDLPSAALSLAGILSVIYGLKHLAEDGSGWSPALFILAGVTMLGVFSRRQRALAHPLIELRLFRAAAFTTALAMYTLAVFAAFGAFFFIGQYLQFVRGLSPIEAGVWFLPSSVSFVVGAMLTPVIVRRVSAAHVAGGGLVLAAAGFALLTLAGTGSVPLIMAGLAVLSLGISPVITLATDLIVGAVPPERAGAASAISETGAELGGALGVAILGSIGTAVYRGAVTDTVPPGVPPQVAAAARETLGGAVGVAANLPEPLGAAVLDAAGKAFVQGLQVTAVISAVVMLGTALLAITVLRQSPEGSATGGHPGPGHEVYTVAPAAQPEPSTGD